MGAAPDLAKHEHTTGAYAAWLTAPEHPRFTRVIANRMWKKVFGRGLIEPLLVNVANSNNLEFGVGVETGGVVHAALAHADDEDFVFAHIGMSFY